MQLLLVTTVLLSSTVFAAPGASPDCQINGQTVPSCDIFSWLMKTLGPPTKNTGPPSGQNLSVTNNTVVQWPTYNSTHFNGVRYDRGNSSNLLNKRDELPGPHMDVPRHASQSETSTSSTKTSSTPSTKPSTAPTSPTTKGLQSSSSSLSTKSSSSTTTSKSSTTRTTTTTTTTTTATDQYAPPPLNHHNHAKKEDYIHHEI